MKYQYIDEKKEHLHTLDGKPLIGTSTVTKVISKPLTWWASGMACERMGWANPKKTSKETRVERASGALEAIREMDLESYMALLDGAYRAHNDRKETAAEDGTDMHAELEQYVKECLAGQKVLSSWGDNAKVQEFAAWATENVSKFLWSESNCFSETLWVGGISDVGLEMKDGRVLVGDFKSSKEAYEDQFIQCAGYGLQIKQNGLLTKDGVKVGEVPRIDGFVIFPFGAPLVPSFRYNVEEYEEGFRAALTLHKLINK